MGCSLRVSAAAGQDFVGPVGATVTLTLESEDTGAEIVHIRYAGDELDLDPPFQFEIRSGLNVLVVLAEGAEAGALLELKEDGGDGTTQVLRSFHFDPGNPAHGYRVKGE